VDYLYALLAMGAIALPLAGVWLLMEWRARRDARARMKR
jgi:hypothetical protein